MDQRSFGYFSLLVFLLTATWLVILIWDLMSFGAIETFDQALKFVSRGHWRYYLAYLNVGLLTVCVTAWMAGLYIFCKPRLSEWAALTCLVFIPVYCTMNLFAYLSQLTLVPVLVNLRDVDAYQPIVDAILRLSIQSMPGSTIAFFNNLAYALLGIPCIIFGWALIQSAMGLRLAGFLLIMNGLACIVGVIGVGIGHNLLSMGSLVGGVLFFLALMLMSRSFLIRREEYP